MNLNETSDNSNISSSSTEENNVGNPLPDADQHGAQTAPSTNRAEGTPGPPSDINDSLSLLRTAMKRTRDSADISGSSHQNDVRHDQGRPTNENVSKRVRLLGDAHSSPSTSSGYQSGNENIYKSLSETNSSSCAPTDFSPHHHQNGVGETETIKLRTLVRSPPMYDLCRYQSTNKSRTGLNPDQNQSPGSSAINTSSSNSLDTASSDIHSQNKSLDSSSDSTDSSDDDVIVNVNISANTISNTASMASTKTQSNTGGQRTDTDMACIEEQFLGAVLKMELEKAEKLLETEGFNVNYCRSTNGIATSLIKCCIECGYVTLVRKLLDKGANVPRNLSSLMKLAIENDLKDMVIMLLKYKECRFLDSTGDSPILRAVVHCRENILHMLCEFGFDVNKRHYDFDNATPIEFSIRKGWLPGIFILLDFGANPYLIDESGYSSFGVLGDDCPDESCVEILEIILDLKEDFLNGDVTKYLHEALEHMIQRDEPNVGFIQILFDYGADPNYQSERDKVALTTTAIFHADNVHVIDKFIENGLNVNGLDQLGKTLIYYAAERKRPKTVRLLLKHNANLEPSSRMSPFTCLDFAFLAYLCRPDCSISLFTLLQANAPFGRLYAVNPVEQVVSSLKIPKDSKLVLCQALVMNGFLPRGDKRLDVQRRTHLTGQNMDPVNQYLRDLAKKPLSLADISVICARKHFGSKLIYSILNLQIPQTLKSHLAIEHICGPSPIPL